MRTARRLLHPSELAELACEIEIDRLGEPIGKQDQYIAAYGGVTCFTFHPDDSVEAEPLKLPIDTLFNLEDNLLLFFTGFSRSAGTILQDQTAAHQRAATRRCSHNLHYVKELGLRSQPALENGDTAAFGELMHEHWEHKKRRSGGMSNPQIDEWYELGRKNGALGGKLVGAGGGGFLCSTPRTIGACATAMARGRARGGALPLRLRRHQGAVRMTLPVAILAGGLATRLRPVTETIPKALVEVAGRPFVDHQLDWLRARGFDRVVFCVGYRGEMIRDVARRRRAVGPVDRLLSSTVTDCSAPAARCKRALPLLGRRVLRPVRRFVSRLRLAAVDERAFRASGKPALMTVFATTDSWDRSNVCFEDGRRLSRTTSGTVRRHAAHRLRAGRAVGAGARAVQPTAVRSGSVYQRLAGEGRPGRLRSPRAVLRDRIARGAWTKRARFWLEGRHADFDDMSYARQHLHEAAQIIDAIDATAIERMAEIACRRCGQRGGRLFFLGVGGSAGNCSHAVNDFRKLAGFEAYAPTDNVSELTARTNDEGWDTVFAAG